MGHVQHKIGEVLEFDTLSHDVLNRGLGVVDSTATSLCMDNDIPMLAWTG